VSGGSPKGEPPSDGGLRGQMSACWKHKLTAAESGTIRGANIPVLCIHGRHDIVAEPRFGEKLAASLAATMVLVEGAHFIPRECGHQVCACAWQERKKKNRRKNERTSHREGRTVTIQAPPPLSLSLLQAMEHAVTLV
jgi:hypothetical protein